MVYAYVFFSFSLQHRAHGAQTESPTLETDRFIYYTDLAYMPFNFKCDTDRLTITEMHLFPFERSFHQILSHSWRMCNCTHALLLSVHRDRLASCSTLNWRKSGMNFSLINRFHQTPSEVYRQPFKCNKNPSAFSSLIQFYSYLYTRRYLDIKSKDWKNRNFFV